jgi:predicted glycosyltransferase
MHAYLKGLWAGAENEVFSVSVTGPLMPAEQSAALHSAITGRRDVQIVTYTTELVPSIAGAELVVSMAGYNTSVELLAARKKAILVPRSVPREEQKLRAGLLARLGLCECVPADERLASSLAEQVPAALAAPVPHERLWGSVDLQGAERIAAELTGGARRAAPRVQGAA